MKTKYFSFLILFFLIFTPLAYSQNNSISPSSNPSLTASEKTKNWRLSKAKDFPLYKVQIFVIDHPSSVFGVESSKAVISNKNGQVLAEVKNLILEPDPKINIENWKSGESLDLDKDGYEDLVLKGYSGGAHCCFNYQIFSLGKVFKKIGNLKLNECGSQIRLEDLNQDQIPEIITCNSSFTYLKGLSFSQSPFPPLIFSLESHIYKNTNTLYPQVFERENKDLIAKINSKTASIADVLEYVLNELFQNKIETAWAHFDEYFNFDKINKDELKSDLKKRWDTFSGAKSTLQPNTNPERVK